MTTRQVRSASSARQGVVQLTHQVGRHGIQALGPVEGEKGDALVRLVDLQRFHGGFPLLDSAISGNTGTAARAAGAAPRRELDMGLHDSSVVDAPLAEVFARHERPGALPRLLPPWQPIKVAQQAQSLAGGRAVLQLPGAALGRATFG